MEAAIPVPIEFSLPEGWWSVPPDAVDAGGSAFVALHAMSAHGFRANITISGEVRDSQISLAEIATEAVERIRKGSPSVQIGRRKQLGSARDSAFTQFIRFPIVIGGELRTIVQFQVLMEMRFRRDRRQRAVIHVVFSALPEQFARLIGDFERFLATVRYEEGRV